MKLHYRTVFLSDLHLGSRGCRAKELSKFLKRIRCERLYLVGDIIDLALLRRRWYWPQPHNDVIRRILKIAKRGTEVIFCPGNHDDAMRQYLDTEFGGVKVLPWAVHCTADDRKLLVIHGDQFDLVVTHSPLLSNLGGLAYEWLIGLNRFYNWCRRLLGMRYFSLSKAIKMRVKSACTFISRFEDSLVKEAKRQKLQGVVCGHIHKAESREEGGIQYFNCGDWIESCTALVEHKDGRMEIIDGLAAVQKLKPEDEAALDQAEQEEEARQPVPELLPVAAMEAFTFGHQPAALPAIDRFALPSDDHADETDQADDDNRQRDFDTQRQPVAAGEAPARGRANQAGATLSSYSSR